MGKKCKVIYESFAVTPDGINHYVTPRKLEWGQDWNFRPSFEGRVWQPLAVGRFWSVKKSASVLTIKKGCLIDLLLLS